MLPKITLLSRLQYFPSHSNILSAKTLLILIEIFHEVDVLPREKLKKLRGYSNKLLMRSAPLITLLRTSREQLHVWGMLNKR